MKFKHAMISVVSIVFFYGYCSANEMYTGFSAGYMIDSEDVILSAHIGTEVTNRDNVSHNLELEIAYTEDSEMGVSADIIPVMLNYRAIAPIQNNLNLYVGLGVGWSMVDVSGFGQSDDDRVISIQTFIGCEYAIAKASSLRLGYRYLYLNSVEVFDIDLEDLDDSVVEVGVVFKF